MWKCSKCGAFVEDALTLCNICGTLREPQDLHAHRSQQEMLEDAVDAAMAEVGRPEPEFVPRIEPPVASGLSAWIWILAVFAFLPFLGIVPSLALALCSAIVLLRPTRLVWDRRIGVGGLLLAFISLGVTALWGLTAVVSPLPSVAQPEEMGADPDPGWTIAAMQLAVLVISIVLHECAHGVSALWSGDATAARHGRLRLNPLAHIDPFGSVILPAILLMTPGGVVFGWAKPVPINRRLFRHPRRGLLAVTLAGVSVNLLLALLCTAGLLAVGSALRLAYPEGTSQGFTNLFAQVELLGVANAEAWELTITALRQGLLINLVLFCFNILPIPPLDGYGVLESVAPKALAPLVAGLRPLGTILLLVLVVSGTIYYAIAPGIMGGLLLNLMVGAMTGWA